MLKQPSEPSALSLIFACNVIAGSAKIPQWKDCIKEVLLVLECVVVAGADDMGVLWSLADNKFEPLAAMPSCVTMAVESGDPTKGASVIVFKASTGCTTPWHWHTPTEQVMIVSGSTKVE